MHELYQTIAAGELKANTNDAFAMTQQGPVVILSRATPKAVLVSPDDWNRIARRLKMLEAVQEALHIEAENDTNGSWITGAELKERVAQPGKNVGSPL